MPRERKRSRFKGKVNYNAQTKKKRMAQFGYLILPKGVLEFQEEPGKRVSLDILPYEVTDPKHMDHDDEREIARVGDLWYKRPFKIHRNVGINNDAYVCPTSIGKKCPICDYRAKQIKEGANKDELAQTKASYRVLYVVVPKNHREFKEEPHIWDMSEWLFQNLLTEELEENEEYEVFPDLEEGLTLKIRFDTKRIGKGPEFAEAKRIDFVERDNGYEEGILDDVPNLDEALKVLSYKELETIFFELEGEEGGEEKGELEQREEKEVKGTENKEEEKEPGITRRTKRENKESKCPHGHKFGIDTEEYDECDDCELWDACIIKKEDD